MGNLMLNDISYSGNGTGVLMLNGVNYTRSGGGSEEKPLPFKTFYTIPSGISGTITAGYVMRGLFGAGQDQNFWHVAVDNDPVIYYNTANNQLVRGDRYVSSGYLTNMNIDTMWHDTITPINTPNPTRATGTGVSSISASQLADFLYLRTVDILDQNGNVVLEANCTLEDLGLA